MNKLLLGLFALLLVFALKASAITDVGLTVSVTVAPDGGVHVNERYSMFLDTDKEIEQFTQFQGFGQNTIVGWRRFVPALRYHLGASTAPSNTKVTARRLLNIGLRSAVLELEYDLAGSIFSQTKEGSRVTRYALKPEYLSFENTGNGEVVLSPLQTLEFILPSKAKIDLKKASPYPTENDGNTVRWVGPITSKWIFQYTLEKALEDEVSDFFKDFYKQAYSLVPTLLPIALILLVSAFLLNKFHGVRK